MIQNFPARTNLYLDCLHFVFSIFHFHFTFFFRLYILLSTLGANSPANPFHLSAIQIVIPFLVVVKLELLLFCTYLSDGGSNNNGHRRLHAVRHFQVAPAPETKAVFICMCAPSSTNKQAHVHTALCWAYVCVGVRDFDAYGHALRPSCPRRVRPYMMTIWNVHKISGRFDLLADSDTMTAENVLTEGPGFGKILNTRIFVCLQRNAFSEIICVL